MAEYRVVLAGPKSEGNVGAVARAMRNFDVEDLVLVNAPELGDEAKARAMHAWDLVQSARRVDRFEDALTGCDYVVGTSARIPRSDKVHLRNPLDPRDLSARLAPMDGRVALCFGREDFGLFNEELERCDVLVTVPTGDAYRSLNLSHAVAIMLYEFRLGRLTGPIKPLRPMSQEMRSTFWDAFDRLVDELRLPPHKNRQTKLVGRRVLGRAVPSAWEYFVLMGVIHESLKRMGVRLPGGRIDTRFDLPEDVGQGLQATFGDSSPSA